jgi:hypothetical protein
MYQCAVRSSHFRFAVSTACKCGALLFALFAIARSAEDQSPRRPPFLEAYPAKIQDRLDARDRLFAGQSFDVASKKPPVSAQYVIKWIRRWLPGSTLTVAFSGGSPEVRARIEKEAVEWSKYCNIKFDFYDAGRFREWSPDDTEYKADIRISFDQKGYWSALGSESIDPEIYWPGDASMNFYDFLTTPPADPYFGAIVKHEFGHALGFEHEHQGPKEGCENELRWDNDEGYIPTKDQEGYYIADSQGRRPGVYTVFSGGPDPWEKKQVDANLKRLRNSRAYETSSFDRDSIMKYYLEPIILKQGKSSRCYSPEATRISPLDRKGAAKLYPLTGKRIQKIVNELKRALAAVVKAETLPAKMKHHYKAQIESLPK